MSRVVNIKGKVNIQNIQLAQEVIDELGYDIKIQNKQFVFNQYDYADGNNKKNEISQIEKLYLEKFDIYLKEIEEEERVKVEEEKRVLREEKANTVIEDARKQGYKLKKKIEEDKTIKLVLQKRVY